MALTERSGSGFIVGGVTDTTPDWLGSYTEGYDAAQQQKTTAINQQEAKQRMGLAVAEEQRLAAKFANEQADRAAALEAAKLGAQMPSEVPFNATPGAGLMPEYQVPPAPPAPAAPAAPVAPLSRDQFAKLLPEMARLEQTAGLPTNYLETISMLESSGGFDMGTGEKFVGIFQIGPEVAADFGVTPEQLRDPRVNAQVAAQLAARNAKIIRARLNREPQPWELYLAHQQGAGGAASLLQNPSMNAVTALANAYGGDRERARQAVIQNGGREDMTAGEFAQLWATKYRAIASNGTSPTAPTKGSPAPETATSAPRDPNASNLSNDWQGLSSDVNTSAAIGDIVRSLSDFSGGGGRTNAFQQGLAYAFGTEGQPEQMVAANETAASARAWYKSPEVMSWLKTNPSIIQEAKADPIAAYNKYKNKVAAPVTPGLQTQPAAPTTPVVQAQPAAPTAPATPGLQTQPAAPGVQTQPAAPGVQAQPTTDYAGVNDGTGSLASSVARAPTGEVPKTPDLGMYLFEPAMITNERRLLAAQRSEIQRQLQMASTTRDFATIYKLREQAAQNQLANNLMGAMEVIATMQQGSDEQFAQTLSGLTQGKQRLQPRSDGAFNVYYDNRLVGEGISRDQIIATLRMQYDQQYQALAAAQAKAAGERDLELFKNELKIREQLSVEEAKMYANIAAKRDELAIKNANPEYNITVGDDGTVTAVPKTGNPTPIRFEPQPILDPDGEPVLDGEGNPRYKLVPMPVQGR